MAPKIRAPVMARSCGRFSSMQRKQTKICPLWSQPYEDKPIGAWEARVDWERREREGERRRLKSEATQKRRMGDEERCGCKKGSGEIRWKWLVWELGNRCKPDSPFLFHLHRQYPDTPADGDIALENVKIFSPPPKLKFKFSLTHPKRIPDISEFPN